MPEDILVPGPPSDLFFELSSETSNSGFLYATKVKGLLKISLAASFLYVSRAAISGCLEDAEFSCFLVVDTLCFFMSGRKSFERQIQ